MPTNILSTVPAVNKQYSDIPPLTSINYNAQQGTIVRVTEEIDSDEIISGRGGMAQPLDIKFIDIVNAPPRSPILSLGRAHQMYSSIMTA